MRRLRRHWTLISLIAVCCLLASALAVQAQDELTAAGNGGTGDSSPNGGAAAIDDVNSGANAGNGIGVGDSVGEVAVDGGSVANDTAVDATLTGGTGISDASGGEDNLARNVERVLVPAPPDPTPTSEPEPTPTPEPEPIPQACLTGPFGTACTTIVDCFAVPFGTGLACNFPADVCLAVFGVMVPSCLGADCVVGPNATTNCSPAL